MVAACREFIKSPTSILTIWGTSGNAKTVALMGTINELRKKQIESVYITAFDLVGFIREAFNSNGEVKTESAFTRLARFESVPVLAIDELDKVRPTEWVKEQYTDLIDRRYRGAMDGNLGTLFAMNSDPQSMDDHIYSRLKYGGNKIIMNNDADMRPYMKG